MVSENDKAREVRKEEEERHGLFKAEGERGSQPVWPSIIHQKFRFYCSCFGRSGAIARLELFYVSLMLR